MKQSLNEYMEKLMQLQGGWYWSGTWGSIGTESLWSQKSQQSGLQQWYIQHADAKAKGLGKKVLDCTGVAKYPLWVQPDGSVPYHPETDLNESMIFQKSKDMGLKWGTIATIPRERKGILVTYTGHMGAYLGDGTVLESRGGSYGVVITQLDGRGWQYWYESPFVDYGGNMIIIKKGDGSSQAPNSIVLAMQKGLEALEYKMISDKEYKPDGSYGTATANGVELFLKGNGMSGDGTSFDDVMNATMITNLVKKIETLNSTNNNLLTNQQTLNNEIAVLSDSVKAKTATISSLSLENTNLKSTNATLVQEKTNLTNELLSKTSTITDLENENGMLERDNAELGKKIESDKFKIDTIEETERNNKEIINNLNEQIAVLKIK